MEKSVIKFRWSSTKYQKIFFLTLDPPPCGLKGGVHPSQLGKHDFELGVEGGGQDMS